MSDTERLAQVTAIYGIRRRVAERKVALAAAAVAKATRDAERAVRVAGETKARELGRVGQARGELLSAPFSRDGAAEVRRTVEMALQAISDAHARAARSEEIRKRLERTRSHLARDLQKRIVKHDQSAERLCSERSNERQDKERRAVEEYAESRVATIT